MQSFVHENNLLTLLTCNKTFSLDKSVSLLFPLQSAGIGGAGHLVNFMGTDTIAALLTAKRYYGCPMAGHSIPAAEHR